MSNIYKGRIKFYKKNSGFGFLEYWDGKEKKSVFTHASQFMNGVKHLKVGQKVRFTIGENEHGPIAQNVEVLKNAKTESDT